MWFFVMDVRVDLQALCATANYVSFLSLRQYFNAQRCWIGYKMCYINA